MHKQPQVYIVMGVAGCGKSTIAKALAEAHQFSMIEGDDFHSSANIEKMRQGQPLTDDDRADWLQQLAAIIRQQLSAGRTVVVSCSALKPAYRATLRRASRALAFIHLQTDKEVIDQRLQQRHDHFMPRQLLDSQFSALSFLAHEDDVWHLNADSTVADLLQQITHHYHLSLGNNQDE